MKKLLMITAFTGVSFLMYAQTSSTASKTPESSVFIKAGVNLANVSVKDNGQVDDGKMIPSFHAGLQADFPLASFLSLQPGVFFTGKGAKLQSGEPEDASYVKATVNPYYIEVPVNLIFKTPGEGTRFFVGAGPYAAIGIAGKRKIEGKLFGVDFEREDKITFSDDDPSTADEEGQGFGILKRFDYGVNGTIGVEGKTLMLSVNYGYGMAKLQSGTTNGEDNNNKHRVLSATIGIRL